MSAADARPSGAADVVVGPDDPLAADVRSLLEEHLAFAQRVTPAQHVHALGVERLLHPAVTFFGARRHGRLLGVGAIRRIDDGHAEVKSMHVAEASRHAGVGRALVTHFVTLATAQGYGRLSLETGTAEAFAPARALYRSVGFEPCPPFGEYTDNPHSICMTMRLHGPDSEDAQLPPG